jgi:transcriptional regulator with GAF, ATPase, and Fis domain
MEQINQPLSEYFSTDKKQKLITELENNQYISVINLIDKQNNIFEKKINSLILSLIKVSYNIKKDNKIIGYIEIFPSYELLEKIFSCKSNMAIIISILLFLTGVIALIVFVYTQIFIYYPQKQIKNIINDIIDNKYINFNEFATGIWKNVILELKRLNNKVFNIDSTMELLSYTGSIVKSDLELVNLIHVIFDVIQNKLNNSMCAILIYDDNEQLKILTKNTFIPNWVSSVAKNSKNYIWKSYAGNQEIVINTKKHINKEILGELYAENIASFISVPIVDNDQKCMGVFVVTNKIENFFNSDIVDIIKVSSNCIALLINRLNDYKQITQINNKIKIEQKSLINELNETNNLLINKKKELKSIIEIYKYICENRNITDIINYISKKVKEFLKVEKFGIIVYYNSDDTLSSLKGSFDISKDLQIKGKKDTIYEKVIETGKYVILNNDIVSNKYSDVFLCNEIKLKSVLFVPIKKKDKVVAVMSTVNKQDGKFSYLDVKFLEYIAIIIYSITDKIK